MIDITSLVKKIDTGFAMIGLKPGPDTTLIRVARYDLEGRITNDLFFSLSRNECAQLAVELLLAADNMDQED